MNGVHIALMGDPTLKLHYIIPPTNLVISLQDSLHAKLNWSTSAESVLGYNVYKKRKGDVSFIKINKSLVNTITFIDSCISSPDTFIYQVRAVKLETTPSGPYFNESLAISETFGIAIDLKPKASFTVTNADPSFTFNNTSLRSKTYQWTFSDTSLKFNTLNCSRTYKKNGDVWVLLTSSHQCSSDTQKVTIKVTKAPPSIGNISVNNENIVSIYPNPSKGNLTITSEKGGQLRLLNMEGKLIYQQHIQSGNESLSLVNIPFGIYLIEFTDKMGRTQGMKLVKE
jgi:PKD repeat protein